MDQGVQMTKTNSISVIIQQFESNLPKNSKNWSSRLGN
jgi:hypothetical protein